MKVLVSCHEISNVSLIVNLRNKTMYQDCYTRIALTFDLDRNAYQEKFFFQIDKGGDALLNRLVITKDIV